MRNKGFTLIEILIAILILGIVLSTIYVSYTGALRLVQATETDAELYSMARTALDRMTRDLEQVTPWNKTLTFQATSQGLSGGVFTKLTFRSSAHMAFSESETEAPAGVAVIEYQVEEDTESGGYVLWRSDSLYRDPEREDMAAGGFVVCDRIETLTYRFFDGDGKEYETWDSANGGEAQKNGAPSMIEIRLGLVKEKDTEHPVRFMTRVRLPRNKVIP